MKINDKILNESLLKANSIKTSDMLQGLNETKELMQDIVDNQEQVIPALVTIYELMLSIAKKLHAEVPKPHCDMKLE